MANSSPTVRRKRLGRTLRQHRADRKASDVAAAMGWSEAKFSRIETGHQQVKHTEVRRLLDHYDVTGEGRAALMALARDAQQIGWWHEYSDVLPEGFSAFLDLEHEASSISNYEEILIPGLLQTEDYARALLRTGQVTDNDDDVERRLEARTGRQDILRREHPPQMRFVVSEAAIRQQVGGPAVLRAQLARLLELGEMLTVTLQVVPFTTNGHAATTSFVIFEFTDDPTVVYLDLIRSSLYVEKPAAISGYVDALADDRGEALSPKASDGLIAQIMKEL